MERQIVHRIQIKDLFSRQYRMNSTSQRYIEKLKYEIALKQIDLQDLRRQLSMFAEHHDDEGILSSLCMKELQYNIEDVKLQIKKLQLQMEKQKYIH